MKALLNTVVLVLTLTIGAWAGQTPSAEKRAITALRLTPGDHIAIDGRLDEPAWERAEPATDFIQVDPSNGAPATERTEVRWLFDKDRLYMGVQCFDSEPQGILGNQMVRDGFLSSDDRFMWTIDPYGNQRGGYFFEIGPGGAMGDAQLIAASNGVGTQQNRAWDGIWLARVRKHDRGWTIEIEIPFRTLNFNPDADAWGANFQRTVRRKNEESMWSGWARNQGLFNLVAAGRIEGIKDVSQGVGLDIKPYLIGTRSEAAGANVDPVYKGDAGVDFFYNITPQLKTNFTINTDFAQTEVDDRQVNLTRFPLFFPEKRDFFLEGSGNFDFAREPGNELNAFFTRRIGLDANGRPQKIDYGVKMNGQAGRSDIGMLQVRTGREGNSSGEDFTVFRTKRRFMRQSYAGLMYTRRSTRQSTLPVRQTVGGDFEMATSRFRGSQNLQFSGFLVKTPNAAKPGGDSAFGLRLSYPNDRWNARASFREVQKNHDPAVGFVERTDYRRFNPVIRFGPRPKNNKRIRQVSMESWFELLTDTHNRLLSRSFRFTLFDLNLASQDSLQVTISPTRERLEKDFVVRGLTLPRGNVYDYTRYTIGFNTANRRKISGGSNIQLGTFYSGRRRDWSATLNVRPRPGVLATMSSTLTRVELKEGSFTTNVLRSVINTQFSPFVSVTNNIQYDTVSRVLGWQFRFRWIVRPGNDVYVVWLNNWRDTPRTGFAVLDRNASTKIVYTQRF